MQKLLLATAATALLALASCSGPSAESPAPPAAAASPTQANLVRENKLLQVFETGEADQLDSLLAPGYVNHAGTGDLTGIAASKGMVKGFHAHFHPTKMDIKQQFANGDHVATWVRYVGPTPTAVVEGIELTRYADGKAVEHWFFPNSQAVKQ